VAASVARLSGSKSKGIEYLYAAANGGGESAIDAKIALVLFLRREGRYADALEVIRTVGKSYPRNFLFALEEARVLNSAGRAGEAVASYRKLLETSRKGLYSDPRLELAEFGLGEALRGQRDYRAAAEAFAAVGTYSRADPDVRERAMLAEGEMYDLMDQRDLAVQRYQAVIAADTTSARAELARKRLKQAYRNP
jgi:tetratricopeptide (TPR) repeat protein